MSIMRKTMEKKNDSEMIWDAHFEFNQLKRANPGHNVISPMKYGQM